jgi:hypothetical protein
MKRGGKNVHSRIVTFALTGAMMLVGATGALAQDATPEAASPFADLGLPELTVTATDEGLSIDQSEIPAGRYLINFDNQTDNPQVSSGFVRLTDDMTLEDLSLADEIASGTPIPPGGPDPAQFAFLYETLIVPGASALSPHIVTDLPAGEYGVWPDDPASEWVAPGLTVTGDPETEITGPEPEAAVTIIEEGQGGAGYSFRLEGELKAGPQVVRIDNPSDQPHFTEADQYPEPITVDQLMGTFMFDPTTGATPSPDMLDLSKLTVNGWASAQSTDTTQWVVFDLEPGQVVLSCWVPDPMAGGAPHAMEGMIQLFDVAE